MNYYQSIEILTKLTLDNSSTKIGAAIAVIVVALTSIIFYWWMKAIGKPTDLKLSDVECDSVTLRWTKPKQGGKHVKSYTILCRSNDGPINQWQSKMTTNDEKAIITNLSPRTCYFFKVRPQCGFRCGKESDVTDLIQTKPKYPGKPSHKPIATHVTQNSICLRWGEPEYGADLVVRSSIFYRSTEGCQNQWKRTVVDGNICMKIIDKLEPETIYSFKVCTESKFGSGPESDLSNAKTDKVLSVRIKDISQRVLGSSSPELYHLKMKIYAGGMRHVLGEPSSNQADEKVLILVGATGAGKTTLLNGIVNYIFGVQLEDNFRFHVDIKTDISQAHSQTSKVTAYTFYPMDGSRLPYPLTVIDTPGFGDTRDDKMILHQILEIVSVEEGGRIKYFNGVGVVIPAASTYLNQTQKYIFYSMLKVFGRNVASNMFLMITFADDQDPPVISAVKEADIPYESFFKFNSSALFVKPATEGFTQLYWNLGKKNFDMFFSVFGSIKPVSVVPTEEVLTERQHLELLIKGMQNKIKSGLDKINVLLLEKHLLKEMEEEIKQNENYTYKVTITKQKREELPKQSDQTALNCRNCFMTCHFPCERRDDVYNCVVMDSHDPSIARCTICPSMCTWNMHSLQGFCYVSVKREETRTIKMLKARYDEAKGHHEKAKSIITILEDELFQMQLDVMIKISIARKCEEHLNKIALTPKTLTEADYVDILIEAEKEEMKEGFMKRIEALEELTKTAKLLNKEDNKIIPFKEFRKDWWISFQSNAQSVSVCVALLVYTVGWP